MINELLVSKNSLDELISFEITSESHYNMTLTHPCQPTLSSGITIGIGYDLGYNTIEQIKSDWNFLPADIITKLIWVAGLTGDKAHEQLKHIQGVTVSYEDAIKVFENKTLQFTAKQLSITYPGVQFLRPSAVGALLSLCYNRGFSTIGSRRQEMYNIKKHILNQNYTGISSEILNMRKYWDGSIKDRVPGLVTRRTREAALVMIINNYEPQQLINITF